MKSKKTLITGITGQDGTYLSRLLLEFGYEVHGLLRRSSTENTVRLKEYLGSDFEKLHLHYGDMTDTASLLRIVEEVKPDELYNLAAQSHVQVSFETPISTGDADALGTIRLLEAIRLSGGDIKFYQASSSELFGSSPPPQSETTPFKPRSPYATAKLYAYFTTINYREAYGLFLCNGILFNHESPYRNELFVTRKITSGVTRIKAGLGKTILLGNLDARRDWGHAEDYVYGMWLMLQQEKPDDFVLATGQSHSVRQWVEKAFQIAGIELVWEGHGVNEQGYDKRTNKTLVEIDPVLFRPTEVDHLQGDASKAKTLLHWAPKKTLEELIEEMVRYDFNQLKRK